MSGEAEIIKQTYMWKAETTAVNEAALKYAVSLVTKERDVPVLKLVGADNVLDQVAEIKAGLPAGIEVLGAKGKAVRWLKNPRIQTLEKLKSVCRNRLSLIRDC